MILTSKNASIYAYNTGKNKFFNPNFLSDRLPLPPNTWLKHTHDSQTLGR